MQFNFKHVARLFWEISTFICRKKEQIIRCLLWNFKIPIQDSKKNDRFQVLRWSSPNLNYSHKRNKTEVWKQISISLSFTEENNRNLHFVLRQITNCTTFTLFTRISRFLFDSAKNNNGLRFLYNEISTNWQV